LRTTTEGDKDLDQEISASLKRTDSVFLFFALHDKALCLRYRSSKTIFLGNRRLVGWDGDGTREEAREVEDDGSQGKKETNWIN